VVFVRHEDGERRAGRGAVAHAADDAHVVVLFRLARAPSVSGAPTRERARDARFVEREPSRQALDDQREERAVRLTRGRESKSTQHAAH